MLMPYTKYTAPHVLFKIYDRLEMNKKCRSKNNVRKNQLSPRPPSEKSSVFLGKESFYNHTQTGFWILNLASKAFAGVKRKVCRSNTFYRPEIITSVNMANNSKSKYAMVVLSGVITRILLLKHPDVNSFSHSVVANAWCYYLNGCY